MLFTKGDRQELMEGILQQKNSKKQDQQTICFSPLLNLESSAVKSEVPYKKAEI